MLTHEGQKDLLEVWGKEQESSDKYLLLLNLSKEPTRKNTMKNSKESEIPGEKLYKRVKVSPDEWTIKKEGDGHYIITDEKIFGSFSNDVLVTHIGLCSEETGTDGILYLIEPIEHYIKEKSARTFTAGEAYMVKLIHKIL